MCIDSGSGLHIEGPLLNQSRLHSVKSNKCKPNCVLPSTFNTLITQQADSFLEFRDHHGDGLGWSLFIRDVMHVLMELYRSEPSQEVELDLPDQC